MAAALQASLPATGGAGIVHGDYRLDNVIVDHDDMSRVAAVLDWEMATLGDPLADLAALVMFWDEPGQKFNPITKGLTAFAGFLTRNQVVERYVTRRGLVVDDLDWYLVFARFRLAIILEQIHVRHLQGKHVARASTASATWSCCYWLSAMRRSRPRPVSAPRARRRHEQRLRVERLP